VLCGHGFAVYSVAFSPDGGSVASGSFDKTVKIWELHIQVQTCTDRCIANQETSTDETKSRSGHRTLTGHTDSVFCVAYSGDGKLLTSCGRDKKIIVWSTCDGVARSYISLLYTYLRSAAFSPDGKLLAAGCGDRRVMLAALPPPEEEEAAAAPSSGAASSVHASANAPATRSALDLPPPAVATPASARPPFSGHRGTVMSVAWSQDGAAIASGAGDGTAMLWCARTGQPIAVPAEHGSPVLCVAFSGAGGLLAAADDGGSVTLWDLAGPDRRLAVAMASHRRLGAGSLLGVLEPELLARIGTALPVWAAA
jgi:WD40 repeat protein